MIFALFLARPTLWLARVPILLPRVPHVPATLTRLILLALLVAGCVLEYDPASMPYRPVPTPSPTCDRVGPPQGCDLVPHGEDAP